MWRHVLTVFLFVGWCLIGSHPLLAQQINTQQGTQQGTQQTGTQQPSTQQPGGGALSVQGPQLITGEQLRASRQPGQLVGGQTQQVGPLRSQAGAAGQAAGQGPSRFGARGGTSPFNQFNQFYNTAMMNSLFNQRRQLRMAMSLGFKPASTPPAANVSKRIQTRLTKIPQLRKNGRMTVEMDGRVAVLRGEVASEHDRDLIARVVLLEPGIADVRNELQVVAAKAAP